MAFVFFAAIGFLLAVLYSLAEAWYERDWPRVMGKFVGIFALLLIGAMAVFV